MVKNSASPVDSGHVPARRKDLGRLTRRLLLFANIGLPRTQFLLELSKMLLEGSGCEAVEIRTTHNYISYRWRAHVETDGHLQFDMKYFGRDGESRDHLIDGDEPAWAEIRVRVAEGRTDPASPYFTGNGSFSTGDGRRPVVLRTDDESGAMTLSTLYKSVVIIRFQIDQNDYGLLELRSTKPNYFSATDMEFYEDVAQAIGITFADRRAQRALRERVKELSCLFDVAQVIQKTDLTFEPVLAKIAELVAGAVQNPEVAEARIVLDGRTYQTPGFTSEAPTLASPIVVGEEERGVLEVAYLEPRTEEWGVVFLEEEANLLEAVARQISLLVQRRQSEEDRARLEGQLRHADRLATIGQLAAGVAHELNEPLGNILGFAQLAAKAPGLPAQATADIDKIAAASLHGREIIKKLLIFARQMPTKKTRLDLNAAVAEGLYFLEARCANEGVRIERSFAADLPPVDADPSQIQQVLVNLVVNAIQAMPGGGTLTITTAARGGDVVLTVGDSGTGMSREVRRQIFLPFFTTKEVGHGTGLGLPVVHGIVTSHGGSIDVWSEVGVGSRFEVKLPAAYAGAPAEGE